MYPKMEIVTNKERVTARLSEFGISLQTIQRVQDAAYQAYANRSPNDPIFTPGTDAWSRSVRALRDDLLGRGWKKDDPNNLPRTFNENTGMNIIVASGDSGTGKSDHSPRTKSNKGIKTELAVEANKRQHDMFSRTNSAGNNPDDYVTWILLINVSDSGVQTELSLPMAIFDGKIDAWKERIIFPEYNELTESDLGLDETEEDEEDEIEIEIPRKKPTGD